NLINYAQSLNRIEMKKIPPREKEIEFLKRNKDVIGKNKVEIEIITKGDEPKSRQAKPMKPGILIE
ncbi:MAG: hypothetical protein J7K87_03950, partial [Candidatus Aenigmarchaeota archaeon]|nr:hypothetical protein [Candidatus Aenigmarchaeota archaeon]